MMREVLYGLDESVKVGGEYVKVVRYADDQAIQPALK